DEEHVPGDHRMNVEESNGVVGLEDLGRRDIAFDDLAEDTGRLVSVTRHVTALPSFANDETGKRLAPTEAAGSALSKFTRVSGTARNNGRAGRRLDLLVFAQEADHSHRGSVALADLGEFVDAGVAARTALEAGADLIEEVEGHVF